MGLEHWLHSRQSSGRRISVKLAFVGSAVIGVLWTENTGLNWLGKWLPYKNNFIFSATLLFSVLNPI